MTQDSAQRAVCSAVRAEMARRRKTQADLAPVLGVTRQAVSRRLTGDVPLTVDELAAIADFLDVPVTQLLGGGVKAGA
ncbi:helix-turn-helix transcriptional regulator [Gordonia malaquae]|uniref:helix-turn-helix transcriptional regulator n=1 Tax=Gordonia malaquae TaxID=410332 RepID=UPI003015B21B